MVMSPAATVTGVITAIGTICTGAAAEVPLLRPVATTEWEPPGIGAGSVTLSGPNEPPPSALTVVKGCPDRLSIHRSTGSLGPKPLPRTLRSSPGDPFGSTFRYP